MFSPEYSQKLPPQSETQRQIELVPIKVLQQMELTCAAYEPRFGITAAGTSDGRFLVMNSDRITRVSPNKVGGPICLIRALVNTSSFVTASSAELHSAHPNKWVPRDVCAMFNANAVGPRQSVIVHWAVTGDSIIPRITTINGNVASVTVSPSHPHFALVGMTDGALRGFSFETMDFTDLYLDLFEGKTLHCLTCSRGLDWFVCCGTVEKLVLEAEVTVSTESKQDFAMIDIIGKNAAVMKHDGSVGLLRNMKNFTPMQRVRDYTCVFVSMIETEKWLAVLRSATGDVIYVDGQEKVRLDDDFVLPGPMIKYGDPFARKDVSGIFFLTMKGDIVDVNGVIGSLYAPNLCGCRAMSVDGDVFFVKAEEDEVVYHRFREATYVARVNSSAGMPCHGRDGMFMSVKEDGLWLFTLSDKEALMFMPLDVPMKSVYKSRQFIDCTLVDGRVFSCESNGTRWNMEETKIVVPDGAKEWRRLSKADGTHTIAWIDDNGTLFLEDQKVQVIEKKEVLVDFTVVTHTGVASSDGSFIVIVTNAEIKLYEPVKLKKIKRCKLSEPPISVTYAEWGGMIVYMPAAVKLIPLPDISGKSLGKLPLSEGDTVILIENGGLALFNGTEMIMYDVAKADPVMVNADAPPIEETPEVVSGFFRSTVRPKATLETTDQAFGFKRTTERISDTTDIMQQLLVTAAERSEKLKQMQTKAENILVSARQFAAAARRFRR